MPRPLNTEGYIRTAAWNQQRVAMPFLILTMLAEQPMDIAAIDHRLSFLTGDMFDKSCITVVKELAKDKCIIKGDLVMDRYHRLLQQYRITDDGRELLALMKTSWERTTNGINEYMNSVKTQAEKE